MASQLAALPIEAGCDRARDLVSVEAARADLLEGVAPVREQETVPLSHTVGRVLAKVLNATFAVTPTTPFRRPPRPTDQPPSSGPAGMLVGG
ncbi:MAG TPA: hypothetical protein VGN83_15940 [Falsiroseomonas sp.]|jgi:hypothetical protein|nr:hypothetical protein [Falsiroseomonas sp.]